MNNFKDLVDIIYSNDDENRRVLFGRYVEDLRARSASNKNSNAAALMGVTERTFQRILQGNKISEDTKKNLHIVLEFFVENIDDGAPVLDFERWSEDTAHRLIPSDINGDVKIDEEQNAPSEPAAQLKVSNRSGTIIAASVSIIAAIGVAVFFWMSRENQTDPAQEANISVEDALTDNLEVSPSISRPAPETVMQKQEEIDILRITKSGERRRSEHHTPKAHFTVWNGKLYLKNLILPSYHPILNVEYSRFGDTFTPFDPSDDLLDRSLAPDGSFLVNATFEISGKPSVKEYDLTTQRDFHIKTVIEGLGLTAKVGNINRHVTCGDDICAVQRSYTNNLLCFGPVVRARFISGFDAYEVDRSICTNNAPLPLCLSEEELGFKLGRDARVVFEVDLIDGTSKRFDVSPRTEGVLLPSGDFVSLDALGGTLTHQCS